MILGHGLTLLCVLQFDKDKSGQLDKGELQAAIKQVLTTLGKGDMACPDGLVDQVLKQLDKDGSGSVSKEEFTKVVDVALKKIEEQEAQKA